MDLRKLSACNQQLEDSLRKSQSMDQDTQARLEPKSHMEMPQKVKLISKTHIATYANIMLISYYNSYYYNILYVDTVCLYKRMSTRHGFPSTLNRQPVEPVTFEVVLPDGANEKVEVLGFVDKKHAAFFGFRGCLPLGRAQMPWLRTYKYIQWVLMRLVSRALACP